MYIVLEEGAFCGCTNLKEIRLSDNISTIQIYTFADCTNLKKINLPINLKKISLNAFEIESLVVISSFLFQSL